MNNELREQLRRVGREAGIFAAIFAGASLIAAMIWNSVVDLPVWSRTASGIGMDAVETTKTVGIDAGYLLVALPIALALGAALMYWRRMTPILTIVLLAVLGVVAAALMERFGLWFGPGSPEHALASAAVGMKAPQQLQVQATGVLLIWPAAALVGALAVQLLLPVDSTAAENGSPTQLNLPA